MGLDTRLFRTDDGLQEQDVANRVSSLKPSALLEQDRAESGALAPRWPEAISTQSTDELSYQFGAAVREERSIIAPYTTAV